MRCVARQRRERGDGAIYHDEERARWVGQLDLGLSPAGRRRRPKVFGTTHQEVKDKLAELREADRQGVDLTARSITFDQLAHMWLERDLDRRVSDSTRANYSTLLNGQVSAAIGHRKVSDLRTDDIEKAAGLTWDHVVVDGVRPTIPACAALRSERWFSRRRRRTRVVARWRSLPGS